MNGAGDWTGSTGAHGKAAFRGGMFAECMLSTVAVLWAATGNPPIVDLSGLGRTALAQARSIVAAPAVAGTPFLTPGRFTQAVEGGVR